MGDQEHVEDYIQVRRQVHMHEGHVGQELQRVDDAPQVLHDTRPKVPDEKLLITLQLGRGARHP